jgi:hypothetical protein
MVLNHDPVACSTSARPSRGLGGLSRTDARIPQHPRPIAPAGGETLSQATYHVNAPMVARFTRSARVLAARRDGATGIKKTALSRMIRASKATLRGGTWPTTGTALVNKHRPVTKRFITSSHLPIGLTPGASAASDSLAHAPTYVPPPAIGGLRRFLSSAWRRVSAACAC